MIPLPRGVLFFQFAAGSSCAQNFDRRPGVPPLRVGTIFSRRATARVAPAAENGPFREMAGGASPSPTTGPGRFPFCVGEPLGAPAGGLPKPRSHPHPPQCEHWGTFPLEAGRLGGRTMCAPTVGDRPVSLVRQSQAREWNRNSRNFCKLRAQWPGRDLERHSDFARRNYCRT